MEPKSSNAKKKNVRQNKLKPRRGRMSSGAGAVSSEAGLLPTSSSLERATSMDFFSWVKLMNALSAALLALVI